MQLRDTSIFRPTAWEVRVNIPNACHIALLTLFNVTICMSAWVQTRLWHGLLHMGTVAVSDYTELYVPCHLTPNIVTQTLAQLQRGV